MDLAKLKVVELRAELSQRGLDAKGNKPVLVERLRKALEEESADPKTATVASAPNTNEESKVPESEPPEPVPPKTPGRTSRSTAASTPSKASQLRGNPKVLLTSLPEKQAMSAELHPVENVEKTPEKVDKSAEIRETGPATEEKQNAESPSKQTKMSPEKPEKSPQKKDIVMEEQKDSPAKVEKTEEPEKAAEERKFSINAAPPDEAMEESSEDEAQEDATSKHLETESETRKTEEMQVTSQESLQKDTEAENLEEPKAVEPKAAEPKAEEPKAEELKAKEAEQATEESLLEDELMKCDDKLQGELSVPEASELVDTEEIDTSEADKITQESKIEEFDDEDDFEQCEAMETNDEDKLLEDSGEEKSKDGKNQADAGQMEEVEKEERSKEKSEGLKQGNEDKQNIENVFKQNEEDGDSKDTKDDHDNSEQDPKDRSRKDRKDRKRKRSTSSQDDRHRQSPSPSSKDDEPDLKESELVLSWYDSDLNLVINRESFLSATPLHSDGFCYMWAGARASHGLTQGKVYYEVKTTEHCEVNLQQEDASHVLRVGWSVQGTTMQLGEEPLSYGFDGTGKICTGNEFSDYGEPFGKDDVVCCYLDLNDDTNVLISYSINGKYHGTAFSLARTDLEGKPLFPHILTKNCAFEVNFGQEAPWTDNILEGYIPASTVGETERVPGPRRPEKREECEMVMMCGLPAAGKTVWAMKFADDNRHKMYNVLGTHALLDKMKVVGLPRKDNYNGRWEMLVNKCTRCLNKLLDLAATRRRNYILDQANVFPSAQRRKMRCFYGYSRKAVVIVPTEEEFKRRTVERATCEGEASAENAVLEMKANFGVPVVGESFDAVEYPELQEAEAKKLIEKYNKEGKEAGYGQQQPNKRARVERSDNHRDSRDSRQDNRQNSRDSRDSRDHRDRRNNYSDRNRNSSWRGGSNSGSGWRDRQTRPAGGSHARHGGGGGYGGSSGGGGGWRGRGTGGGHLSSYRAANDRRVHDRRASGNDRSRSSSGRQGSWGPMNSYHGSQQQSSGWGGSQSGSWMGQAQHQGSWGGQQPWSQQSQGQQQQQWGGNWKGYGQCAYSQQSNYSQQGYGNGNWGSWNQQYYNQYWGGQHQTTSGQTSAAGSQAASATGSVTGNSTTSTSSTYGGYSPGWQGYSQSSSSSYSFPQESSNTNAQQQK